MERLRHLSSILIAAYLLVLTVYLLLRLVFGGGPWWLALLNNFAPYFFVPLVLLTPWALLARLHPRFVVLPLILLLIGLVWFGPRFAPRPQAAPAEKTFKVISLNVWGRNRQLDLTEAWLREQNADVVLMQEAYHDMAARLSDLYPYALPDASQTERQDRQILSRYPLFGSDSDDGYMRAEIGVNGTQVAVYNVHFSIPFTDQPHYGLHALPYPLSMLVRYNESSRNEQIRALLARLQGEEIPLAVVGGDFNTSDNSAIYPVIAAQLTDSYREMTAGLGATFPVGARLPFALPIPPFMRIDYLWHTDALRAIDVRIGPEVGSDHRPLVAVLALPE